MTPRRLDLEPLLAPRSVAVVGATERLQHGGIAFRNLLQAGFRDNVYPINPKYRELLGVPCYGDFASLPRPPDCAVFAIPGAMVPAALKEAGEAGVRSAVVLSSGFAELGPAGRQLQDDLAATARTYGMPVCGPNCMGIVNLVARVPMYTGLLPPDIPAGRVAVVTQSGSVTFLLLTAGRIACSYAISSGNQAVLDATDYLDHLVDDPDNEAIALFIEAIPQAERFLAAVERAHAAGKPIVIMQPGRSQRAAQSSLSHTGTLAGSYEIFSAICRQYGLIQVDDFDEMVEVLALITSTTRRPKGAGLGIVDCSGGENALVMDLGEQIGLQTPPFAERTASALKGVLPHFATVSNPLDVTGALYYNRDGYAECLRILAADPELHMIIAIQDVPASRMAEDGVAHMCAMAKSTVSAAAAVDKPIAVLTNVSGDVNAEVQRILLAGGVPVLEGARKGLQAAARFLDWAEFTSGRPSRDAASGAVPPATGEPAGLAEAIRAAGGAPVGEAAAFAVLARSGLPVARSERAKDGDGAAAAAERIGFPVVVKIDSPDVAHKSDVGGVAVGLEAAAAVAEAFAEIVASVHRRLPAARLDGVVVQEMIAGGTEVALGMKRDARFGPMIMLALGGIFIEVLQGFVLRRAPLTLADARAMIAELPGRAVLEGARGRAPADVDALAQLLVDFSRFAVASPALAAIDLNPVIVLPRGRGVRIADALLVPSPAGERALGA